MPSGVFVIPPPGVSHVLPPSHERYDLSEPPARLRRVDAVGIGGGSLYVINLPAREVRTAHVPLLALAVCCQDEGSLSRADQYPYTAHDPLLSCRAPSRGLEPHLTNLALPFPPW